jgi:ABC-type transport system involved in multi-copper enzyme maturation permease subunit
VLKSTMRMFELAMGQLLWGRRAMFMMAAAGAPVVLALMIRLAFASGSAVFIVNGHRLDTTAMLGTAMSLLYLRFIVPALGVLYGTSLIADEVEEKTITYLFLRPMPRGVIVAGKYLAYLVCVNAVVLPSAALVFLIMVAPGNMGAAIDTLVQSLGRAAVGLAAYGALFTLVGASFRRPLVGGLIFVFGWEQIALVMPGYLGRLTIAYYLQNGGAGFVVLLAGSLAAVAAAMWTVGHREYVLQQ